MFRPWRRLSKQEECCKTTAADSSHRQEETDLVIGGNVVDAVSGELANHVYLSQLTSAKLVKLRLATTHQRRDISLYQCSCSFIFLLTNQIFGNILPFYVIWNFPYLRHFCNISRDHVYVFNLDIFLDNAIDLFNSVLNLLAMNLILLRCVKISSVRILNIIPSTII